jgi:hypothetical protein
LASLKMKFGPDAFPFPPFLSVPVIEGDYNSIVD